MNLPAEVGMLWILVGPFAMLGLMKWLDKPMTKTEGILLWTLNAVLLIFIILKVVGE